MPVSLAEQTWLAVNNVWQQYQDGCITDVEALAKIAEMTASAWAVLKQQES
jgi:hypothetical protein